jgi:SnoaL-like domain
MILQETTRERVPGNADEPGSADPPSGGPAEISELVIKYAVGVDRRDWKLFADCFTDPVYADFSELGGAAGASSRAELVGGVAAVLDGFTVTQHLSPNHLIEFDATDPDRAVCYSYMYAQHVLDGSAGGEFYLLRGWYANHVVRTPGGWRIERLIQHVGWQEGNTAAVAEAAQRNRA